jgi:hypothetical protein
MNPMTESNRSTSSKLVRDVVALGKKYARAGFPNPSREGCPSPASLRAMAYRDRRLTLKDLPASHVVTCSPCFQQYSQFRRTARVVRGIRITVAALAVAAMIVLAIRFTLSHTRSVEQRAITPRQAAPAAPVPFRVDLASFSPTRGGAGNDSERKVHLPQKVLKVELILPIGMEPGQYEIRLQSSGGTVLIDKRAQGRMNRGVTAVELDIDLANAPRGNSTLMILPPGLDWWRFPAVIE